MAVVDRQLPSHDQLEVVGQLDFKLIELEKGADLKVCHAKEYGGVFGQKPFHAVLMVPNLVDDTSLWKGLAQPKEKLANGV